MNVAIFLYVFIVSAFFFFVVLIFVLSLLLALWHFMLHFTCLMICQQESLMNFMLHFNVHFTCLMICQQGSVVNFNRFNCSLVTWTKPLKALRLKRCLDFCFCHLTFDFPILSVSHDCRPESKSNCKFDKKLQFYSKVKDAVTSLSAQKSVTKKKNKQQRRQNKKLKAYNLSPLLESLPELKA